MKKKISVMSLSLSKLFLCWDLIAGLSEGTHHYQKVGLIYYTILISPNYPDLDTSLSIETIKKEDNKI